MAGTISAFTIHNLAFQGNFASDDFPLLGLDRSWYSVANLEFYGRVNLMKGAVVLADGVSTVSPTYAHEVAHDAELGFGLDGVLRDKGDHFVGILNGADYDEWDPAKDQYHRHPLYADPPHRQKDMSLRSARRVPLAPSARRPR